MSDTNPTPSDGSWSPPTGPQHTEHPPSVYQPPLGGWTTATAAGVAGAEAPPSPPGNSNWKWIVGGVAALLAVLLLAFGAALLVDGRALDVASPTSSGAPSTSAPAPPTSSEAPSTSRPEDEEPTATTDESTTNTTTDDPATSQKQIDEIISFVEKTRGLSFKTKPVVRFADDDEFSDLLLKDFEDDKEDMDKATVTFRALGFIPPDADYA